MELYLVIPQVTSLRSKPRRKSTQTWLIKIFSLFVWLIRISSNSLKPCYILTVPLSQNCLQLHKNVHLLFGAAFFMAYAFSIYGSFSLQG